jgi:hypothetical protein
MVDEPDRPIPRFPNNKTAIVEAEIIKALEQISAGDKDLALTQGASGGDLIFAECCLARGVNVQFLQPFPEDEFMQRSVTPSVGAWLNRYSAVKQKMKQPVLCMPIEFVADNSNPFEACNSWLLNTALSYGAEKVRFICLWNGQGGDAAGGTAHMVEQVKKCVGRLIWLDTRRLW